MDSARWQRVQELFHAACDQPAGGRLEFLREACGDDDALYREVESLLAAEDAAPDYLDEVAGAMLELPAADTMLKRRIGPFTITEEIGAGGMGIVYRAERRDGDFEQEVALKIIRRGLDSAEILRRFQSERRILAQLDHPNIARLLDGGLTDDGLPYFTMEYVRGEPIGRFCERRQLGIKERLRLFRTACEAVAHAQRRLIVHRDLKPDNILVTEDGTVKLLDFGIAKVLIDEPDSAETADMTRTGVRVMTPSYAAPEQVRGEAVTTATDVYALGVVLYELLTGQRPYETANRPQSEVERIICTTQPQRPSTLTGESVDGNPQTVSDDRWRRQLRGDIDNICLKALRKEPERRYASAAQLAEDITRHLDGMPVRARPDTLGYRTQKFIARHRGILTAAVALLTVTIGLTIFYTSQLSDERDRAQREALKAAETIELLTGIFELSDPLAPTAESITVRELLERGAARIDTELSESPDVRATMLNLIGTIYISLGLYDDAETLIARGLELRRTMDDVAPEEMSLSLASLAGVHYEQGDFNSADTLYAQAFAFEIQSTHPEGLDFASLLHNWGSTMRHQGDFARAESLYVHALEIRRRLLGDEHPDIAYSMNHLSRLYYNQGDYERAEPLMREALAMRQRTLGDDHPETGASQGALAGLLLETGHPEEAETHYRESLRIFRAAVGPDHPYAIGSLGSLGRAIHEQRRFTDAEPIYREALERSRRVLDSGHPFLANRLMELGVLLTQTNRAAEGEPLLREALAIKMSMHNDGHWEIAVAEDALGFCLTQLGGYDEAGPLLSSSYMVLDSMFGAGDRKTRTVLTHLADFHDLQGEPEKAERHRALLKQAN